MISAKSDDELGLLAKLVIAIGGALLVAGVIWHGFTEDTVRRVWTNLVERRDGPMAFRFILQPLMAATLAVIDGFRDARAGRAPYFWTILSSRRERIGRLREGLNATAQIILLGIVMDVIYQALVLKTFYPNEALIVALLLAFLPYLLVRGIAARVFAALRGSRNSSAAP